MPLATSPDSAVRSKADAEASGPFDLSVVMPCLNEADTLANCILAAQAGIAESGVRAEIIIADNGSDDGSQAIAREHGARVVPVENRGYGSALMGGFRAARGHWIIMADADESYDFREIPRFVEKLREGNDLVQGCRLERGGGQVMDGAMPFLHRWWGNPMFSFMARWWFQAPINDIQCGMRGFRRDFILGLDTRCGGMEFASEMIIKATLADAKIGEVPITLHPDGRRSHTPHLRTFRDGWRNLRFFLMYSPRWLFWVPGLVLVLLGLGGYTLGLPGMTLGGVHFGAHTMLFASVAAVAGYQAILFAVFTKVFGIMEGFLPPDPRVGWMFQWAKLERGLVAGGLSLALGMGLLMVAVNQWVQAGFGDLDYAQTMRWVVPGTLFATLGVQTILSSFFLSILGMRRE